MNEANPEQEFLTQRIKLTFAYDGRKFDGWQRQVSKNSVQDFVEAALLQIAKAPIRVHASGRTDSGVHALGQIVHMDVCKMLKIPVEKWPIALNVNLPQEIRCLHAEAVPQTFHSRFSALGKTYSYKIVNGPILMPFDVGRAWHVPQKIEIEQLAEIMPLFLGTHDFADFAARRGNEPAPIPEDFFLRTISKTEVVPVSNGWEMRFSGNGFLYKMVRLMVGSIVDVARNRLSFNDLKSALFFPKNKKKPLFCAPPDGLTLVNVDYPAS